MNFENIIEEKYRELEDAGLLEKSNKFFLLLYKSIEFTSLKIIFISLHKHYVELFKSMNERLPTHTETAHFWGKFK